MAAVLVASKHAARHLTVNAADEPVVVVCGLEGRFVSAHEVPFGRFAEAFGHVDIVPVWQSALLHPVGRAAVYLLTELEQERLAGAVVEPDDGEQVVAAAAVLPVVAQELLVGVLEFPLVVSCEDGQHALVTAPLVVVLQDLQRKHVGPKLPSCILLLAPCSLMLVDGTEESVGLTAAQNAFYPELRLVYHRLVAQDVGEVGIASEPVRHFFPAVTATGFEPRVALLVEPVADFAELTAQAVLLPNEHLAHPATGRDGCRRQLDEGIGRQRRTIVDVECACAADIGLCHHVGFLCHERQLQHQGCQEKEGFYSHYG